MFCTADRYRQGVDTEKERLRAEMERIQSSFGCFFVEHVLVERVREVMAKMMDILRLILFDSVHFVHLIVWNARGCVDDACPIQQ